MIRVACLSASSWLSAQRAGLSAASALRLEEHLGHCAECAGQALLLHRLREVSDAGAEPLSPSARQRAVSQALAQAQRRPQPMAAGPVWLMPSAFGALAGVALLVLGIVLRAGSPVTGDRVLSGEVEVAGRAVHAGAPLAKDAQLQTQSGARVALAHATLELRKGTQARWNSGARLVRLERGSLSADVDPTRHQSFSVETARFSVLVLGTSFDVSLEQVKVMRGRVQVVSARGETLAVLVAGQSWRLQPETAAPPPVAPPVAPPAPQLAVEHVEHATLDVDAQLERARQALGQRELGRAQKLLGQALAVPLQAKQRAEALSLQAECALVAGDLRTAEAAYTRVAVRYATSPAGENAAFAAARMAADRNSERGLVRYLARYPHGRFVKEANARLRELRSSAAPQP
jgi:ferric-dicitrate binding protein FerR (iron transport regulator)